MTLISLIDMKLVSLEGRHGPFLQVFLCLILFSSHVSDSD